MGIAEKYNIGTGASADRPCDRKFRLIKIRCRKYLENIQQAASDIWNGIKTTVVNVATSLKDAAVGAFKKLVSE